MVILPSFFKLYDFTVMFQSSRKCLLLFCKVLLLLIFRQKRQVCLCYFTPALLDVYVILPLFQDQSFDTFRSDLSNKIRYNFNFVNLDSIIPKSIQTQFIITQFACNHQTIRDNHEISCQHTDICHINIYIVHVPT